MLRTLHLAALAMLAGVTALPAAAARDVHVTLKASAVVAEPSVRMGAIASIEGDASIAGPLARFDVANAPRPGYSERLALPTLQRYVRARFPEWSDRIEWSGAPAVEVEIATAPLDPASLRRAAMDHLRAAWSSSYELSLSVDEPLEPLLVPTGRVSLRPRALSADAVPARRTLVWIDAFVNGTFQRSIVVPVHVVATSQIFVARTDLAAEHETSAADFESRRIDVTTLPGAAAREIPADENHRLRRTLHAGEVLLASDVVARPAVARGDEVTLRAESQMVRIEAKVVALSDAGLGQALWVRRGEHGETLRARVVAPGMVEVAAR